MKIIRHSLVDIEAQEACAPEGAGRFCCDSKCNQGRDCPASPIKTVEEEFPWMWIVYLVTLLATVAGCALVQWVKQQ